MKLLSYPLCMVAIAILTACAQSTASLSERARANGMSASEYARRHFRPVEWPLKFDHHVFSFGCYGTLRCAVTYAGPPLRFDRPFPPSSQYGPGYLDHIMGGHVGIANFPPPADLSWTSGDGTQHTAEMDIGDIFRDERVLHNVARGDVADQPDGRIAVDPLIFIEINDRTVRVWMRGYVPTKQLQIPGNPYSDSRDEMILARTYDFSTQGE